MTSMPIVTWFLTKATLRFSRLDVWRSIFNSNQYLINTSNVWNSISPVGRGWDWGMHCWTCTTGDSEDKYSPCASTGEHLRVLSVHDQSRHTEAFLLGDRTGCAERQRMQKCAAASSCQLKRAQYGPLLPTPHSGTAHCEKWKWKC